MDNAIITINANIKDKDKFQYLYPNCLSRFIRQCIKLALIDRNFFNDVFFERTENNKKDFPQESIF